MRQTSGTFILETDHPVADSRDTTHPGGTMMDNTKGPDFLKACYDFYCVRERPFALLDLGCAGGALVRAVNEQGLWHQSRLTAVGLEGAPYSLERNRAEWVNKDCFNLFCCDITKPFTLTARSLHDSLGLLLPFRFDVVTAWEVIEHIQEGDLGGLTENVLNHLMPDGLFILSVSVQQGFHHRTIQPKDWWTRFFAGFGIFNRDDIVGALAGKFVRADEHSFHLALQRPHKPTFPECKEQSITLR